MRKARVRQQLNPDDELRDGRDSTFLPRLAARRGSAVYCDTPATRLTLRRAGGRGRGRGGGDRDRAGARESLEREREGASLSEGESKRGPGSEQGKGGRESRTGLPADGPSRRDGRKGRIRVTAKQLAMFSKWRAPALLCAPLLGPRSKRCDAAVARCGLSAVPGRAPVARR